MSRISAIHIWRHSLTGDILDAARDRTVTRKREVRRGNCIRWHVDWLIMWEETPNECFHDIKGIEEESRVISPSTHLCPSGRERRRKRRRLEEERQRGKDFWTFQRLSDVKTVIDLMDEAIWYAASWIDVCFQYVGLHFSIIFTSPHTKREGSKCDWVLSGFESWRYLREKIPFREDFQSTTKSNFPVFRPSGNSQDENVFRRSVF